MKSLLLILVITGLLAGQSGPPRKDIPAIANAANGAIVSIIMSNKDGHAIAQGSGFLVSDDGVILTNYHVIAEGSSAIVKLPDGAFYVVDGVLESDKVRDIAVIKAHGQNFRTLPLGNSDRVQVGEDVVAIGNPLSLESTVSNGIVSGIRAVEQEGGKYLQITAPISPGSSGGPLFNMSGEVIGITTMYLKGGENLNFAIPINDAKLLLLAGSKVRDFPAATSDALANLGTPATPNTAPSGSVSPTTARAYYKQLYDADGFTFQLDNFVCFNERPESSLQWFFTFSVITYDEQYAKAFEAIIRNNDDARAWNILQSIRASKPNLYFQDDADMSIIDAVFGAGTEAYLRSGGQVLTYTPYDKGVKIGSVYYRGAGNVWTLEDKTSNPLIQTEKTSLQFEPTNMRYVMRSILTFTDGETHVSDVVSGMCETIPPKQSN